MVEVAAGPSDSATHEKVLYVVWKYGADFQLLHFSISLKCKDHKAEIEIPVWK